MLASAPHKQLPAVMLRVDASIDPYKQRGKIQCLTV